jgi:glycosyltransferase involved in cell wall biosynthesis
MPNLAPCFVLPTGGEVPSGGHLYNQYLLAALRRQGVAVQRLTWAEHRSRAVPPSADTFWFDTLDFEHFGTVDRLVSQGTRACLIVHHLDSLSPPEGTDGSVLHEVHERPHLRRFDGFLATSAFTRNYLVEKGYGLRPILVVPPALNLPPPKQPPTLAGIEAVMVANWVPRKGLLPWLEALQATLLPEDAFRLKIIGATTVDGAYAQAGRALIDEHPGLKAKVQVLGALPHSEVWEHYRQSNLFISASRMETFGMALQEAAALGLPRLNLAGGYSAAHARGDQGGVTVSSYAAMAQQLRRWLDQPRALQALQAQAQYHRSPPYTWDDAAQQFIHQSQNLLPL